MCFFGVFPCLRETSARPILWFWDSRAVVSFCFLAALWCCFSAFSMSESFLYLLSSTGHVSSVLTATLLVARFGAAAAAAYDLSTTVGVAISTSFLASINDSLFCTITCCTRFSNFHYGHSLKYAVGSLAVYTEYFIGTCLVVMVKLTTTSACQFATTGILTMSKPLAFKAMQGIWNKGLNRYIKITCLDSTRKGWNVKCDDKCIRR